jgi:hypothetical protein
LSAVELLVILAAAIGGCALAWFETGRDRDFAAASAVLIGALFAGGLISVAIA